MSNDPRTSRIEVELDDDDFDAHLRDIVVRGDPVPRRSSVPRWRLGLHLMLRALPPLLLLLWGYSCLDLRLS